MLAPRKNFKHKGEKNDNCDNMAQLIPSLSMHNNELIIETSNESTPSDAKQNVDIKSPLRIKNSGLVGGTPTPKNNLLSEACLNNMCNKVTHKENVCNKNRNMVIIQLDKKFLTKKKPSLKDSDEKKE